MSKAIRCPWLLPCGLVLLMGFLAPRARGQEGEGEGEVKKVRVNFSGLDLATLAKQVEKVTKRSFLYDENLLRNKKVTLQSDQPIGADEFYRVFQAVCQINGLAIVPVEGSGIGLEKIVNAQGAFKEPGNHPVLVQGEAVPPGDNMVSFLAKLQHVTPAKVLAVITPALSPVGSVTQIPHSELLMINDAASSVKRVEKMLQLLDRPGEPVDTAVVKIANIPVDKAQAMLREYLQAVERAITGEAGREQVTVLLDERLNALHLIGPQGDVARAKSFLKEIDLEAPAARRTIQYYKLNNVPVKDIVDYVGQLLGVALAAHRPEAPVAGGTPEAQAPTPPAAPRATPGTAPAGTTASQAVPAEIIPVEGLNTLVVAGDATVHKEVAQILENLDKRKGQVLIEVAIVQVTGDKSLDLGMEFLALNDMKGNKTADGGSGFGLGEQVDPAGRGFPVDTIVKGFTGAAFRFAKEEQFAVVLRALAGKSNVSIVSQPLLLVNDNEKASFTTKVSEPTTTTSQGTATTNTSFAGFADATTALQITPHISPDGYLNLEIKQTFEEFTGPSAGAGIPPPKVSNDADTKVTIPDRQTIVIGGFTRDSATDTKSGVPGLSQIPGLGKLFSRETKRKTASRLYLFVRPKILSTTAFEDLKDESGTKKDDVEDLTKKSQVKKEVKERIGRGEPPASLIDLDEPEKKPEQP